jgi:electron transfer flavoprotein beta subunit
MSVNIIVCAKQVPARDAALVMAGGWVRESDMSFEMNEPDAFALEEALRLKEKHGGEVAALTLGPARAAQVVKEALAKGADRGIHVTDEKSYELDPLASARILAAAVRAEKFDLILTASGKPACCWPPCWASRTPASSCASSSATAPCV